MRRPGRPAPELTCSAAAPRRPEHTIRRAGPPLIPEPAGRDTGEPVLARGFQEASNEVLRFIQDRLTKNVDSLNRLAGCRSVQDVVAVQSELVRETLWQVIDANKRVAELSLRIADEAARAVHAQADGNADRARRAA